MKAFDKIGNEGNSFEIFQRKEGGTSIVFKVSPDLAEKFKKFATLVPNNRFFAAANAAGPDRHAYVTDIPLWERMATICFDVPTHKQGRPVYKITSLK
ncbi:MAG: hypothetical protein LBJ75_03290 [Puniceicoccales bacterium]|nr:hypothetical protein [Puniceicoccales bacterium]